MKTMTIEEVAKSLSQQLVLEPAKGESSAEFRLGFARTLRIPALTESLLEAVADGRLRIRWADGGYRSNDSAFTASSQVDIDEARAALKKVGGWTFIEVAPEIAGAGDPVADDTALPWVGDATIALPVTAKEIAAAFPVTWADKWPDRLKKAAVGKSYQWLNGTVVRKGSRKPGDANTYSPAAVATALVLRGEMTRTACDAVIRKCFPAWLDEWKSQSEYLKS